MLVFKNIFLLLIFLYSFDSFGQGSSLEIAPLSNTNLLQCVVIISDGEGNVILENQLSDEEIKNGTILKYNNLKNDKSHFTIIAEYGESVLTNDHLIKAITYYDIDSSFKLTSFTNPSDCSKIVPQPIQVTVENAREVERVHYNFGTSKFKSIVRDRDAIKVNFSYQPEEDLMLIFECATSPYDRYVYVPFNEVKNRLTFNLMDLPSELKEISIDLHEKRKWFGNISGRNLLTNSYCQFYTSDEDPLRLDLLKILLPADQIFESFNIKLGFETTDSYFRKQVFYNGINKELLDVPEMNADLYYIYDFDKTDETIKCKISGEPDIFQISLIQLNDPLQNIENSSRAFWNIIAQNQKEFSFHFPKMSTHLLDSSQIPGSTMGGWIIANTSLIKNIDKEILPKTTTYDRLS